MATFLGEVRTVSGGRLLVGGNPADHRCVRLDVAQPASSGVIQRLALDANDAWELLDVLESMFGWFTIDGTPPGPRRPGDVIDVERRAAELRARADSDRLGTSC